MTDTEPDGEEFGDEGAGPEEPAEVVADPENQAAAAAIRDSTLEGASTFGDMAEGEAPTVVVRNGPRKCRGPRTRGRTNAVV